jgi:hypothetical protein
MDQKFAIKGHFVSLKECKAGELDAVAFAAQLSF